MEDNTKEILEKARKLTAQRFAEPLAQRFAEQGKIVSEEKGIYEGKLEEATGGDVFKYLLLINVKALEGYTLQTREQAEQSFQLSKRVALAGFIIIVTGIVLGILSIFFKGVEIEVAYLASVAGILTQFISAVFFYLYNRTLQQLNLVHNKVAVSQHLSMSFLGSSHISDDTKSDDSKAELSKLLLSRAFEEDRV